MGLLAFEENDGEWLGHRLRERSSRKDAEPPRLIFRVVMTAVMMATTPRLGSGEALCCSLLVCVEGCALSATLCPAGSLFVYGMKCRRYLLRIASLGCRNRVVGESRRRPFDFAQDRPRVALHLGAWRVVPPRRDRPPSVYSAGTGRRLICVVR